MMIVGLFWGCMMLRAWSQFTSNALQLWVETFLPDIDARTPAPPLPAPTARVRSVDDLLGEVFPDGVGV
jgi:hypothetical protein